MPRGPRISYPNAVMHVINRFVDRHPFFRHRSDYQDFLDVYFEEAKSFGIWTYAYDLVPNHFHLVLETPSGEISRFLQRWLSRVAQGLNRKRGRVGHLFQGRSKTLIVETDRYFKTVIGYTLLNRTRAGLSKNIFSDPWNSVKEMTNPDSSRLAREPLWEYLFGHRFDDRHATRQIRECVNWLRELNIDANAREFREGHHGGFLSTPAYREKILTRLERRRVDAEGVRRKTDRHRKRWTWDEIERAARDVVDQHGHRKGRWRNREHAIRDIRCYVAHVGACWTWNQILAQESHMGIPRASYAMAVSRIRRQPAKKKLSDLAINLCLGGECYNVKE